MDDFLNVVDSLRRNYAGPSMVFRWLVVVIPTNLLHGIKNILRSY